MREPLTIAAAQPLSTSGDVGANTLAHAAAVRAADARVVVFPELSLTAYELDAPPVRLDDPRLQPIVQACADTGSAALVGAPVPNGAGRSIGVLLVAADRIEVAYRKMWLGGDEPDRFLPGGAPSAVDVDGWRVGLAVCKDTGIPQHTADTAALGIDVYAAGVLEDATVQEQRARRIVEAHGVWVVVASFAGSTGGGTTQAAGRSAIWNPDGHAVARAGPEPGEIVRATLV